MTLLTAVGGKEAARSWTDRVASCCTQTEIYTTDMFLVFVFSSNRTNCLDVQESNKALIDLTVERPVRQTFNIPAADSDCTELQLLIIVGS